MASVTRSAGLGYTSGSTSYNWANPTNIYAQDSTAATAMNSTSTTLGYSNILLATNFGFSIPTNSSIDGIVVEFYRYATNDGNGYVYDKTLNLVLGGLVAGTSLATTTHYAASDVYASYGGSTNLWGNTLTPAIVNANNFGVSLSVYLRTLSYFPVGCDINHVRITVYYTITTVVPNLKPRIDGVLKSMVSGSVRIDGALKTIDSIWARVDGVLKKL